MKPLCLLTLFFSVIGSFAQQPRIEVKMLEYIYERESGDNRIVFAKDTIYQQMLKRSFTKAISDRWNVEVPEFQVKVNKISAFRMLPKFKTPVANADTTVWNVFLQIFDRAIPYDVQSYSAHTAKLDVRYRMIRGGVTKDKSASFNVIKDDPPFGQIRINRYPYHPSDIQSACDTIFRNILDDTSESAIELHLHPACGYATVTEPVEMRSKAIEFTDARNSIKVGEEFSIIQDSVSHAQTGKIKHAAGNIAGGLLTLFSNIDSQKKRSILFTADHTLSEGANVYHAYMRYADVKVADRRRVKDDDGLKSVEVGEYQSLGREIRPDALHVVTLNGDTVASFNINSYMKGEIFNQMWNGEDSTSVDSLPAAFNNAAFPELEMKGVIGSDRFVMNTRNGGKIKTMWVNDEKLFTFFTGVSVRGKLLHRNSNEQYLKMAALLCLLADKYYLDN